MLERLQEMKSKNLSPICQSILKHLNNVGIMNKQELLEIIAEYHNKNTATIRNHYSKLIDLSLVKDTKLLGDSRKILAMLNK